MEYREGLTNILKRMRRSNMEEYALNEILYKPAVEPKLQAKAMFHGIVLNRKLWSDDKAWTIFWKHDPPTPRKEPYLYKLANLGKSSRAEADRLLRLNIYAFSNPKTLSKNERRHLGFKEEHLDLIGENFTIRLTGNPKRVNGLNPGEETDLSSLTQGFWRQPENVAMIKNLACAGFENGGWRQIIAGELPGLGSVIIRDALTRKDHWAQLMLLGLLSTALWIVVDLVLLCMGRLRDSQGLQVRLKPIPIQPNPIESMNQAVAQPDHQMWNPLNLNSWYYGRAKQKLKQSFNTCISYSLMFFLMIFLMSFLGCQKMLYELPAGGGEPELKQIVKQVIKIKEVPIVNPLSNLIRPVPPIEEILKNFLEETMHRYEVGQGKGKGAGFAGGTRRGKVRFIRLRYAGGDWDQDLDLNSDLNMLLWYPSHTDQPTAKLPETRSIGQLKAFPATKSPPWTEMRLSSLK